MGSLSSGHALLLEVGAEKVILLPVIVYEEIMTLHPP